MNDRPVVRIAEINALANDALGIMSFWVQGEVSGYKNNTDRSYYYFFDLKDEDGSILPLVIDPKTVGKSGVTVDNGLVLVVHGKLGVYAKRGTYRMTVDELEEGGAGKLAKELEALKARLQAEGLLSNERKRPLPAYPEKIGVITSIASDGWADFQRHSVAKYPLMELFVRDVKVQGATSAREIVQAIQVMQKLPLDVLVLIRGGGSQEDLASFNDEGVARAIAGSRIPVMVGVGHEKDVSLSDLVADVRASTPTNAGQILTRPYEEAERLLQFQGQRLLALANYLVESSDNRLDQVAARSVVGRPEQWLNSYHEAVDYAYQALGRSRDKYQALPFVLQHWRARLENQQTRLLTHNQTWVAALHEKLGLSSNYLINNQQRQLQSAKKQLDSLSPLAVLERGYSLVYYQERVVRQFDQVSAGDTIKIRLRHGQLDSTVVSATNGSTDQLGG